MDNDVFGTDYYIGFSTAVTRSVEFINALRTPAGSHEPIAVVELFGRNSGETALISAYLADVDRVIISEVPFDIERLAKLLVGDKRDIECLTVFAGSAIISLLFRMMIPYAPPAALRICSGGSCAYAAPDTSHHLWHIDMFLPQLCLLRPILQEHMRQPLYGTRRLVAALRRRYARSSLARLLLFVGALALLFGRTLVRHILYAARPLVANDDMRQQIYPFFRFTDPQVFPNDLAARYYLDSYPLGYRLFYAWLARVYDPAAVTKVVPYLLLAALLIAVGTATYRLGGWICAWFSLVFCLSSPYFLARLAGGLPRAFGCALLACALAMLVYGRIDLLGVCAVLSAAFYPPVAVLCGLTLAIVLFLLPPRDRGHAASWTLQTRCGVTALTLVLCAAILAPTVLAEQHYGRPLRPNDVIEYPELGLNGRYGPDDRAPFDSLPAALFKLLPEAFRGREVDWAPGLYAWITHFPNDPRRIPLYQWGILSVAVAICVGVVIKARSSSAARRILALLLAVCAAYLCAQLVVPYFYLPQRYPAYAIPLVAAMLLPVAIQEIATLLGPFRRRRWLAHCAVVVGCGAWYLTTGGQGNAQAGLFTVPSSQLPLLRFVASLPPATRIAAWPSEIADNIPYFSRRQVLINSETHQVFHQGYADEMRRRMRALIDAYYATDAAPLIELRDRFGVDYLVIDEQHFSTRSPVYFQPFEAWIVAARTNLEHTARGAEVLRQAARTAVFRDGPLVVLDLRRLSPDHLGSQP